MSSEPSLTPANVHTLAGHPLVARHESANRTSVRVGDQFIGAGTFTLIGVLLAVTLSAWFLLIPALVGLNQLLMVTTSSCPASLLLSRLGIGTPTCN